MHRSSEEKDEYADQIQSVVTSLLDDVAPLRYVRRRPRKATSLHTGCLRTPSKRSAIADDSIDRGRSRALSPTVLLTASRVDTPTN